MSDLHAIERFDRARSHEYMSVIETAFVEHFVSAGYAEVPGVPVTQAKQVDPSTRFIGSHTSVVKSLMYSDSVAASGHFIVQNCVRTQNLTLMARGEPIYQGSVFPCNGLLVLYESLESALAHLDRHLAALGLSSMLLWQVRSDDADLLAALRDAGIGALAHTLPDDVLRHRYGDKRLTGRDVQVEMLSSKRGRRLPVAVVSAIHLDRVPRFCEVSISPGKILQQLFQRDHFLDCFPVVGVPHDDVDAARKLEDCIVLCVLLLREGLRPGGSSNTRRLLRKYLAWVDQLAANLGLGATEMRSIVSAYEHRQFGDVLATLLWDDVTSGSTHE